MEFDPYDTQSGGRSRNGHFLLKEEREREREEGGGRQTAISVYTTHMDRARGLKGGKTSLSFGIQELEAGGKDDVAREQ